MKFSNYPKRDAVTNYFPLPNEIFMLGLTSGEIAVYSYLLYLEDRKTFQCYPSYKTIGKAVKMSKNTVRKYVVDLESKKLITTEHTKIFTKDGLKQNGNLLYTIRPIQEAINHFYAGQFARAEQAIAAEKIRSIVDPLKQRKDVAFPGEVISVV